MGEEGDTNGGRGEVEEGGGGSNHEEEEVDDETEAG